MTEQSLQLSTLTLAGFPTTSLRTQFLSTPELRNLFLLVADIFRKISLLPTKIQTYVITDNRLLNLDKKTLNVQESTTANTDFASGGVTPMLPSVDRGMQCKLGALCFYSSAVLVESFVLPCLLDAFRQGNPPGAKPENVIGH